ncbi:MAG: DUF951 domain-containing protein [Clostridiales bacterium]|nr:MAG: DUF951 domain-containing protein [Clostridiales bacterium]
MPLMIGDEIETKKQHPCGAKKFIITRAGMDFRMKCSGCGKEIWIARVKLEKRIKKITRQGVTYNKDELLSGK